MKKIDQFCKQEEFLREFSFVASSPQIPYLNFQCKFRNMYTYFLRFKIHSKGKHGLHFSLMLRT